MIRAEMMDRMPATEFLEWHEVARLDPFGGIRGDIQAALIAMHVVNMSGKTVRKDVELKDLLLDFAQESRNRQQTPEEMHAKFLAVFEFAKKKQQLKDAS